MTLKEAAEILEKAGFEILMSEDFGIGVGAPLGADQGIPQRGDCKAVVPFRMDGGKPKSRKWFIKKKKKRKSRR